MKYKKKIMMLPILILSLIILGCGCESQPSEQPDKAADESINTEANQYWREIVQSYRADDKVNQLLLVRYTGGCSAKALFYTKDKKHNDAWILQFEEDDARVGKYGINKEGEGDAKTPTADLGVGDAFGILSNPGTKLPYIDITENSYACDEDCEYYNQIVDTAATGHECTGEEMYLYSPEYNYGMTTDYNADNVYPNGSAIFIHCKGLKYFTGGCVALDQDHMEMILKYADPGMRVVIGAD